jgi:pyruvate,water dikinase
LTEHRSGKHSFDQNAKVEYGRMAINLDVYGRMADLTPGTSAVALEEQMFGVRRAGADQRGHMRRGHMHRYPAFALRAPRAVLRAWRDTVRDELPIAASRQRDLARLERAGIAEARGLFAQARCRLEEVITRHILLTALAQAAYERVARIAHSAGRAGDELALTASRAGTAESRMVADLQAVADQRLPFDTFLQRHGYHGTDEGHLNGVVWRQDPGQLQGLLRAYRTRDDRALATDQRREEARVRARRLVRSIPPHRRPVARAALWLASATPGWRELGKSSFLQVVDVGRAAALRVGDLLSERGDLLSPTDVFFLTARELLEGTRVNREIVDRRRRLHQAYQGVDLPTTWTGVPHPVPVTPVDDTAGRVGAVGRVDAVGPAGPVSRVDTVVRGLGVSAGTATGRVAVLSDPHSRDVGPDDVLVCRATDPSWAATMALSAAIVIDIGGPISHGAIVARELGIPCVINTGDGTRVLHDGDRVTVDGTAGTVTVVEPAPIGG